MDREEILTAKLSFYNLESMQPHRTQSGEAGFLVVLETPQGTRTLTCGPEEYVWDAAARQGIALPAICHQGRCLTCAGKLLSGLVDQRDAVSYFPEDQAAGFVLPCRAKPLSDLRILTHQSAEMRSHRMQDELPAPYS